MGPNSIWMISLQEREIWTQTHAGRNQRNVREVKEIGMRQLRAKDATIPKSWDRKTEQNPQKEAAPSTP